MKELANRILALGLVEESDGNFTEARSLYEESLRVSRVANNKSATVRALFNLAYNLSREGDYFTAAKHFEESLLICRELDDRHLTTMLLLNLGDFALQQQDLLKADEHYKEALTLSLDLKNKRATANSLLGFSAILCAKSLYPQSANLQGFALKLLNDVGAKLIEQDSLFFYKTIDSLKNMMGETLYHQECDNGEALSLEQAIDIALHPEGY